MVLKCSVYCTYSKYRWKHIYGIWVVNTLKKNPLFITATVCVRSQECKCAQNDLFEAVRFCYLGKLMLQEMHGYQLYCAYTHSCTHTQEKTLQLKTPVMIRASDKQIQIWFKKAYGFISAFFVNKLVWGWFSLNGAQVWTITVIWILDSNHTSSDKL